jgi:RNA polymerase-binding transcription factor DksA
MEETMATQRKSGSKPAKAAKRPAPKKPASKPAAGKVAKPAPTRKAAPLKKPVRPAPKAAANPVAKAAAKPAAKAVAKPAAKAAAKPAAKAAAKPAAKAVAKPAAKAVAKPAAKAVAKPAAKAVAKPAAKPRPVARPARPAPEVKPIGVLPPESRARVAAAPPVAIRKPGPPGPRPAPRPDTTGAPGVTEKDTQEFEQRLLTERGRILKQMGHLENTVLKVNPRDSAGDLSGYSFHMADAGTDAMEREKAFLFASAEGRLLMEINDALQRLYRGEYGVCEICTRPIARARLEAMPYARLCLSCKEKEEKAGRALGQAGQ